MKSWYQIEANDVTITIPSKRSPYRHPKQMIEAERSSLSSNPNPFYYPMTNRSYYGSHSFESNSSGRRKDQLTYRCLRVLEIPTLSASSVSEERADSSPWLTPLVKNGIHLFSLFSLVHYTGRFVSRWLRTRSGFCGYLCLRLRMFLFFFVFVCLFVSWCK